ncbi:hypothetical protein [Mycobacterium xenopi]|nr:hypothetical protein [Mycobacterium xenopi]
MRLVEPVTESGAADGDSPRPAAPGDARRSVIVSRAYPSFAAAVCMVC